MVSIQDDRISSILELFTIIDKSGLSAKKYFATHETPMSIVQFFRLKKRYQQQGSAGLIDQRQAGNARKLSPEQMELVRGVFAYNRHLSSKALQDELRIEWGIDIGPRRIDQLRQQFNLPRVTPETDRKQETVQFAGIEIFSAIAHYVGILDHWNTTIEERLQQIKQTRNAEDDSKGGDHTYARRRDGTFSPRYNRIARVRRMKYASIDEKVNYHRQRRWLVRGCPERYPVAVFAI